MFWRKSVSAQKSKWLSTALGAVAAVGTMAAVHIHLRPSSLRAVSKGITQSKVRRQGPDALRLPIFVPTSRASQLRDRVDRNNHLKEVQRSNRKGSGEVDGKRRGNVTAPDGHTINTGTTRPLSIRGNARCTSRAKGSEKKEDPDFPRNSRISELFRSSGSSRVAVRIRYGPLSDESDIVKLDPAQSDVKTAETCSRRLPSS